MKLGKAELAQHSMVEIWISDIFFNPHCFESQLEQQFLFGKPAVQQVNRWCHSWILFYSSWLLSFVDLPVSE